MVIFQSEEEFLKALDRHDDLVRQCVAEEIGFAEFCERYNDFYAYYALDGHESDEEESDLFDRYDARIEPHRVIAYDILGKICSDDDAMLESYKSAGRFGSEEALRRLKNVAFSS